ncbi:MAG TPA: hypothetical protein VFW33_20475, partial [Gemmataceae bacterium]|nr:hypothetical protein [Gemmataceae bacterium]
MCRRHLTLPAVLLAVAAGAARAADAPPVTALKVQKVGDVTYFRVSFEPPEGLDLSDAAAREGSPGQVRMPGRLPRLVPQDGGAAAVYLDMTLPARGGPASVDFTGKVTGRDPARLLLMYPTRPPRGDRPADAGPAWAAALRERAWAEVPVTLDFGKAEVLAADPPWANKLWAAAQARHFAALEALAPGFGFYGFARAAAERKYGVRAPALAAPPAEGGDPLSRLYEMT